MKKISFWITLIGFMVMSAGFVSCKEDDNKGSNTQNNGNNNGDDDNGGNNGDNNNGDNPNTPVADPEGTITMLVRNASNGSTKVPLDNSGFGIDGGNNFISRSSGYDYAEWRFASVGEVKGLGNVPKIPDSGWSTTLAVIPGNGYVGVCYGRGRIIFARIYVEEWTLAAGSNGIIGAKIKYQYPFNGTATSIGLSQNSITLDNGGGTYCYSSFIPLNKVSGICKSTDFRYYGNFSFNGSDVNFYVVWTDERYASNPTMTISSPGLPDEYIEVSP